MPIERIVEEPWYVAELGTVLDDDRPLIQPVVAPAGSEGYVILHSYVAARDQIARERRPPPHLLRRRALLGELLEALILDRAPILTPKYLAFLSGGELHVMVAPTGPMSAMARLGAANHRTRAK